MSVSYTCPDPNCGVTLKTPNRIAVGKSVKCPKCGNPFVPEPAGMSAGERPEAAARPAPAATTAAKVPFADDEEDSDESVKRGYGVIKETEAERKEAAKNKPKFTEVQDKFKKSARGPAQALLVMPSNILLGAGIILCTLSIVFFIIGMWPLVFNDAPPGEEELDEAVFGMLMGVLGFVWGGIVCYGASQMQELGSYIFATLGAIMGVPLLVGIFALIMLQNPKVKAGFQEAESGPDELDKEDEDGDEEGAGDDDDDDDRGPGAAKKRGKESDGSRRAKKAAGVLGGMLLGAVLGDEEGGDDDYEDEDEPEDEPEEDEEDEEEVEEEDEEVEEDEEEDSDDRKKRKKKRR